MAFNKRVEWNDEKNVKLQNERGISFEDIYIAIQNGHLIKVIPHPHPEYAHQQMCVVELNDYIVLVPFVEDEEKIFWKTAYFSRKAMKDYQTGGRKK